MCFTPNQGSRSLNDFFNNGNKYVYTSASISLDRRKLETEWPTKTFKNIAEQEKQTILEDLKNNHGGVFRYVWKDIFFGFLIRWNKQRCQLEIYSNDPESIVARNLLAGLRRQFETSEFTSQSPPSNEDYQLLPVNPKVQTLLDELAKKPAPKPELAPIPPPQRPIPTQQDMQDDWKEVKIADMTPLLTRVQNPAPEFKPVPVKPGPEVEKPAPVLIAPTKTTEVKPSITEVVPPPKTQTEQVKKKKHPAFDYDSDQEF
jgi:hypothetical protein